MSLRVPGTASTLVNRLLGFKGTVVDDVRFADTAIVVAVRLSSRMLVCPCGRTSEARYDRSRRTRRHVDFGHHRVLIEAEIRRVDCRGCGQVRSEWMPWARPGARHTRDFEDMAAWLVKRMSKTGVAALLGTTWETVDALVARLVDEHLLYQIAHADTGDHLRRWITRATRSGINAFVTLARRLRRHRTGILNAIHLQLSNSMLEGINAGIRLIQRRAHGYANLDNLIEMIHPATSTAEPAHHCPQKPDD